MRIFHITTAREWREAATSGDYRVSTRGRTLEQEGFIHCSTREQVPGTFNAFYADAGEPLVLLTIDTDRLLKAEMREEQVETDDGLQTFPHVYGPINRGAVVDVAPLNKRGGTMSVTQMFFGEMFIRIIAACLVMVLTVLGAAVGANNGDGGRAIGALAGLGVGLLLWWLISRSRRRARDR